MRDIRESIEDPEARKMAENVQFWRAAVKYFLRSPFVKFHVGVHVGKENDKSPIFRRILKHGGATILKTRLVECQCCVAVHVGNLMP